MLQKRMKKRRRRLQRRLKRRRRLLQRRLSLKMCMVFLIVQLQRRQQERRSMQRR